MIGSRLARTAVVAVVGFVLAAGLSGCTGNFYGVGCNFNVQNAHQRHSNSVVMNAKATIKCSASVTSASGTIKMQRYTGGKWVDVAGTQRTTSLGTVPANVSKQFETNNVPCVSGTYRAAAKGSAKLSGNPNRSVDWQYGNSAPINCK